MTGQRQKIKALQSHLKIPHWLSNTSKDRDDGCSNEGETSDSNNENVSFISDLTKAYSSDDDAVAPMNSSSWLNGNHSFQSLETKKENEIIKRTRPLIQEAKAILHPKKICTVAENQGKNVSEFVEYYIDDEMCDVEALVDQLFPTIKEEHLFIVPAVVTSSIICILCCF